jgi:hypothetical protein
VTPRPNGRDDYSKCADCKTKCLLKKPNPISKRD